MLRERIVCQRPFDDQLIGRRILSLSQREDRRRWRFAVHNDHHVRTITRLRRCVSQSDTATNTNRETVGSIIRHRQLEWTASVFIDTIVKPFPAIVFGQIQFDTAHSGWPDVFEFVADLEGRRVDTSLTQLGLRSGCVVPPRLRDSRLRLRLAGDLSAERAASRIDRWEISILRIRTGI